MAGKHITVDAPAAVNPYKKMPEGTEDAKAPDDQAVPVGDGKGLPDLKLPDIGKLPDVNIPEQESESGDLVKAFKRELPDLPELSVPSNETSASASTSSSPTTAATATAEARRRRRRRRRRRLRRPTPRRSRRRPQPKRAQERSRC